MPVHGLRQMTLSSWMQRSQVCQTSNGRFLLYTIIPFQALVCLLSVSSTGYGTQMTSWGSKLSSSVLFIQEEHRQFLSFAGVSLARTEHLLFNMKHIPQNAGDGFGSDQWEHLYPKQASRDTEAASSVGVAPFFPTGAIVILNLLGQ